MSRQAHPLPLRAKKREAIMLVINLLLTHPASKFSSHRPLPTPKLLVDEMAIDHN